MKIKKKIPAPLLASQSWEAPIPLFDVSSSRRSQFSSTLWAQIGTFPSFSGVSRRPCGKRWSPSAWRSDNRDQRRRYDMCHARTGENHGGRGSMFFFHHKSGQYQSSKTKDMIVVNIRHVWSWTLVWKIIEINGADLTCATHAQVMVLLILSKTRRSKKMTMILLFWMLLIQMTKMNTNYNINCSFSFSTGRCCAAKNDLGTPTWGVQVCKRKTLNCKNIN